MGDAALGFGLSITTRGFYVADDVIEMAELKLFRRCELGCEAVFK